MPPEFYHAFALAAPLLVIAVHVLRIIANSRDSGDDDRTGE